MSGEQLMILSSTGEAVISRFYGNSAGGYEDDAGEIQALHSSQSEERCLDLVASDRCSCVRLRQKKTLLWGRTALWG